MRPGFKWLIALLLLAMLVIVLLPVWGIVFGGGFDP
jgi:hypothetical protein